MARIASASPVSSPRMAAGATAAVCRMACSMPAAARGCGQVLGPRGDRLDPLQGAPVVTVGAQHGG
jgi:hypothetical protein